MTDNYANAINQLGERLEEEVVGQSRLIQRLLVALLADGHLLLEGAPGLAKTRAVQKLAEGIQCDFQRIQFTPDLLPGDITGTDIYRPQTSSFEFQPGPVFHNLVLADEINRAPAKVQAALLEAMAERQVSVGKQTYRLPELFMVLATQNPVEQEGTYPLPEAQLDRFLMKVIVEYPNTFDEKRILQLVRRELQESLGASGKEVGLAPSSAPLSQEMVLQARKEVLEIHVSEAVEEYIVQLVAATRRPDEYDSSLAGLVDYGASPRASLALERTARAVAWLENRSFVSPDDVQSVAKDVLRHRLVVSFEAEARGLDSATLIDRLLDIVPVI